MVIAGLAEDAGEDYDTRGTLTALPTTGFGFHKDPAFSRLKFTSKSPPPCLESFSQPPGDTDEANFNGIDDEEVDDAKENDSRLSQRTRSARKKGRRPKKTKAAKPPPSTPPPASPAPSTPASGTKLGQKRWFASSSEKK